MSNMTGVLLRRANVETDTHSGRTSCQDKGRDLDDAYTD